MHRVMLLNPKGGSGKTTMATSLAGYYASRKLATVLFDHDAQGSSTRWLRVRPVARPEIHGVAAFQNPSGTTRSWQMRVPAGTDRVVVDTPAGIKGPDLHDLVRRADSIVIPVLPSHIDIDAVSAFIEVLRNVDVVRSGSTRVAVVANRVSPRRVIFKDLEQFLERASFPFITRLRESQHYIRAAERGLGIHEMRADWTRTDRMQWAPLLAWLEGQPVEDLWPQEAAEAPQPTTYSLPI